MFSTPQPSSVPPVVRDADRVPAWIAYGGVLVVGGTALIVLAYFQHRLAMDARMPWLLSWSFSIGLDWGSVVGGVFWFFGAGALSKWGRFTAISLVLVSTVLTCIAMGRYAPNPWWAALGVIHPAVAFLMAKLLTLWQAERARGRVVRDDLNEQLRVALEDAARWRGAVVLAGAAVAHAATVRAVPRVAEPAAQLPASVAPAPLPSSDSYVHDWRDLEPGTEEWQARWDAIPGSSLGAKARHWLMHEYQAGREPKGSAVDKVVGGGSQGRLAKAKLKEQGILPPSESRPSTPPVLVAAS